MKTRIVIVLGPTGVGKSELALGLAQKLNGEIVNADSQQVYRYMDIGTAKPSKKERETVRHHLIDIIDPDEEFNAAIFRRLAADAIAEIGARGRRAIVCGGTGLYLKALTRGLFEGPGRDAAVRRDLEKEMAEHGSNALYERLAAIDPPAAATIHPNDRQRIIRALEVYQITGKAIGAWQREHAFQDDPYDVLKLGLKRPRSELYDLINRRSESMVSRGLLHEVRDLAARGYNVDMGPLRSVGYRQMGAVVRGEMSLAEALEEMKQETRHLAKRQLTWFRSDSAIRWFHPEAERAEILAEASRFFG